jgi:superfamily II DNA or RNA helicase
MARPAILAGHMSIPTEELTAREVSAIKGTLRVKHQLMGEKKPQIIEAFSLSNDGYIRVPRQYGIDLCRKYGIEWEDHTSAGTKKKWPKIPEPRDYQHDFIDGLSSSIDSYYDFLARAHTGFGKTISSLIAAARLGTTTLIVVDQENLKEQWIKELTRLFGFKEKDIGIIQGPECSYKDKAVTIAMVQSLSQKDYPEDMYSYFGLVIVDEVHIIGAPTFSFILMEFAAAYRMGVSATPKRKDGLQKLLDYNLGRVRVAADKKHDESVVYFTYHETVYSWYANISPKTGRFISEVSEDGARNLLVAEAAIWLYETGRDVLVLSDRIEHLEHLKDLCFYLGVPGEEMGVYAGRMPGFRYEKDPKPNRRPPDLERGAAYTPVHMKLISRTTPKKRLAEIKDKCRIIFATYGMFAKGVDVPRLAGGVDATPRAAAEQVHGRILRELDGKLKSIWITVADWMNNRAVFSFMNRVRDYSRSNGKIFEWAADGRIEQWDVHDLVDEAVARSKELKSLQIVTNSDGLNTLQTQKQEIEQSRQAVKAIADKIRARQAPSREGSLRGASAAKSRTVTSTTRLPSSPSPSRRLRGR